MEENSGNLLGIVLWIIIGIAIVSACGVLGLTLTGLASLLAL